MGFTLLSLTKGSFLIYALNTFFNPVVPSSPVLKNEIDFSTRITKIPEDPICIVGAGISGINLANILQTKGYKVIVFEKKGDVGGKAVTFRIQDEVQVEMGPIVLSPHQKNLISKIRELGLNLTPFNISDRIRFDPNDGEIYPSAPLTAEQKTRFENAIQSYIRHVTNYTRDLETGYLNASPDLHVSIWEWLSARNLQILRPIFNLIMTGEGYGALEDIPAIYALKVISRAYMTDLARKSNGTLFNIQEGMDVFLKRMAAHVDVKLNSDVFFISREKGNLAVFYKVVGSKLWTYNATKCYKVILAFPPLLKNVEPIVTDLSDEEKAVLKQVKIHKYSTAAAHMPSLENTLYFQDDSQHKRLNVRAGVGEVVLFARQTLLKAKNIYSCYSWIRGDYNTTYTEAEREDVNRRLESTVRLMSKDGKILYKAEPTDYFPHVNTKSLLDGFYRKFDAIQGNKDLYYATTLLTFEVLNEALKMTEYIGERYF